MTARRLAFYIAFTAGLACAQSPQLEIRGTVVEDALGIGGVTVTLYEFGHTPAESTTRAVFATTSTDSNGAFIFHPARAGLYYVEVKKEGYFAESFDGPTVDPVDSTGDLISIDADHPLRERQVSLMRLGELRGRVIDEDGKPLANLRVSIRPATATLVITDQDGYFTATKLRPGDYVVSVSHKGPEILTQFSEDDLKIVDQDWEGSSWPAVPVPVRSGASLSIGTIIARKTSYYRAHLSVQSDDCAPGEKWSFSTTLETAGRPVPCGKEFLVRNLAPGSYSFSLTHSEPRGSKAVAPVEVTDRNVEITMTMSASVSISGRITTADGTPLPSISRIRIATTPVSGLPGGIQIVVQDPAGMFLIPGVPADRRQVIVTGLASNFYVKEIRYDGLVVEDGIIMPIPDAPGQLDIVIDDHAATINGLVAERDKVTGDVIVVAMQWPLSIEAPSLSQLGVSAPADDQGRFQIGGLAPGEYRVLAVAADRLSRVQLDIVNRGERVTVERGSSHSVSLKITEP